MGRQFHETNADGSELLILFGLPEEGATKEIAFTKKPLGLDFNKKVPITVRGVSADGAGAAKGVRLGWKVLEVNGVDLSTGSFAEVFDVLSIGSKSIPKIK